MIETDTDAFNEAMLLTVRVSPERVEELRRLAEWSGKGPDDLATEFRETQIEAQHGLT